MWGRSRSGGSCDGLGENIRLSRLGSTLEVRAKMREAGSYCSSHGCLGAVAGEGVVWPPGLVALRLWVRLLLSLMVGPTADCLLSLLPSVLTVVELSFDDGTEKKGFILVLFHVLTWAHGDYSVCLFI